MTAWTGTVPTFVAGATTGVVAQLNTLRDALKGVSDAEVSYTPVWTAITVNPAIGNGTIVGSYTQSGKRVFGKFKITMGSTTTYGTGGWLLTLPVTPAAGHIVNSCIDVGACLDLSAVIAPPVSINRYNGADGRVYGGVSTGLVGAAIPFAWATGDIYSCSFSYEAA